MVRVFVGRIGGVVIHYRCHRIEYVYCYLSFRIKRTWIILRLK